MQHNRLVHSEPLKEIEKFAHLFHERAFEPKELVFADGDLGDAVYLLKTGHVRLYRITEDGKELTLAILGPGDVFGELALFGITQRRMFAQALEEAHICTASVDALTRLMGHHPRLTAMVATEIAKRRSEMEARVADFAYGSVRARLLHALHRLHQEHGETRPDGKIRIDIRLSHRELGELVGTTRETCTVECGKLQETGALCFDDDHHMILDLEKLEPRTPRSVPQEPVSL